MTRYWIAVASKDHIANGVAGGFMQANHGKSAPLKRMKKGDWVIFYSPKKAFKGNEALQAFTAIGQASGDDVYEGQMHGNFMMNRRNIDFYKCGETPIASLIDSLSFIENKRAWGYKFRFGFFEIPEQDFEVIRSHMINGELEKTTTIN